ncbi:methylmalonyl Co-A mutase-associated GTPase MeaB [Brachymonas sp. G13]|uniref:methylmalonyl Co-A mutase-associated GTPase MeaB n=1 Tax=Brachymonas TaxID=28219 RepID=UPI002E75F4BC|nr:methylmalonyl Co-A mutase-associated GTPase MeaB [Brachymonas sp. J145]MEE1653228.1 methylmalonyl Co-A mutase-associated GTPase MeaB [Brachymonas sp. J145]
MLPAVPAILEAILHGDAPRRRRGIAKAITLLESTRADHRALADELLTALLPHTGKALRLGLSGVPGVGKSTFVETLGLHLTGLGLKVAVLAIDPSSSVSGGSILGDKTRMERLSREPNAYIRPSPSSCNLGGVAEKTREAMLVCEAAGYDVVIIETVGVGQSETAVHDMADMFVVLQLPNAGDDLQAIKKGVMEMADLVVINKADIDPVAATRAQAQITSSLRLLGFHGRHDDNDAPQWQPRVLQISALEGTGVEDFWAAVEEYRGINTGNGKLAQRRQQQSQAWMWERIDAGLKDAFRTHAGVSGQLPALSQRVQEGSLAASTAARQLLQLFQSGPQA